MKYTQEEIKKIAKEYLRDVKAKTGWNVDGVTLIGMNNPALTVLVPGWSEHTEADHHSTIRDPRAQISLDTYWKVADTFRKKYKGIEFDLAGGSSGPKIAKTGVKMDIKNEINEIANRMAAIYIVAYTFESGFRTQAEQMYKQLRLDGLNPKYGNTSGDTEIMLPKDEIKALQSLQKSNPARYGNLQNYKIAKNMLAADSTQAYRQKRQSCDFAMGELRKAMAEHAKRQKLEPNHFGYVGDLGFVLSQLNQMIDTLNGRE